MPEWLGQFRGSRIASPFDRSGRAEIGGKGEEPPCWIFWVAADREIKQKKDSSAIQQKSCTEKKTFFEMFCLT